MAGFNVPPKGRPVPMTPNRLAQLAAGAVKPPGQRQAEEMALRRAQYAMMLDRLRTQGGR